MKKIGWWVFQLSLTCISLFFAIFGVDLLIGSYSLENPFTFIMTFFAASFMILISLALMTGFIIRMVRVYRYLTVSTQDRGDGQ
ncbi:MAG: hypothetical protein R6V41_09995 [Desulfobacteraceae bacterium]